MTRSPRSHGLLAKLLAGAGILCVAGFGCAKAAPERTVLQGEDLATGDQKFDKNEIVDSASFTDNVGLDLIAVQSFLRRTPYRRASFLETYQSNGVRAVDAILGASARYRLNPLVFLVRLEMAQGLVGEQFYPFPPKRVEYVFGCGCPTTGTCDPHQAGLDRQIECLGRALRTSLDEVAAGGATAGKWGPGKASLSLDGQTVTPVDDSTAALYQYAPIVGTGVAGNWVFWNIWQAYAKALDYQPPLGPSQSSTGWVGDACQGDATCGYQDGQCATGDKYPGGLCTAPCTKECPTDPGRAQTFCADLGQGTTGYCLQVCNPNAPACRQGYKCVPSVAKFGDPSATPSGVCFNQQ